MRELIELGYNVIVVNDAVGAPGEEAYHCCPDKLRLHCQPSFDN